VLPRVPTSYERYVIFSGAEYSDIGYGVKDRMSQWRGGSSRVKKSYCIRCNLMKRRGVASSCDALHCNTSSVELMVP